MIYVKWVLFGALGALLFFYVIPTVLTFILTFYGRYDPETALKKRYFVPFREEMDSAVAFLSALPFERAEIKAGDGVTLRAKYLKRGGNRLMMLVHGYNASSLANFAVSGRALWEAGFSLLMIDERAHGESGGRKTGFGLLESRDLALGVDWAEKNAAEKKRGIYGVSMGSTALAFISDSLTTDRVKALIFDCGFISPRGQMQLIAKKRHAPGAIMIPFIRILAKVFIGVDINDSVLPHLARSSVPSLFLYGDLDATVPIAEGREFFAASSAPKLLLTEPTAEHTMCFTAGKDSIRNPFFDFVNKYVN